MSCQLGSFFKITTNVLWNIVKISEKGEDCVPASQQFIQWLYRFARISLALIEEIFLLADIVIPLDYIPSLFTQLLMQIVPEDDALIAAPTHAVLFNPCTPDPR